MRDIKDIINFRWELLDLKPEYTINFKLDEGELFDDYGLDTEGFDILNNKAFYALINNNYIITLCKTGVFLDNLKTTEEYYLKFENMVFLGLIDALELIKSITAVNAEEFIKFAEKNFIKIAG